ncbi:MAG: hypothetical protein CMJ20_08445 [Phycisphaeraceae bacterium]|nr:hypothetical protein [Phycisphaeraceae bacterium]
MNTNINQLAIPDLGGNDQFRILECFEVRHTLGQHPSAVCLENNDLLYTYDDYTDAMEGSTGYVLRSTDYGRTWSDPILVLASRVWHGGIHLSLGMQALHSGRVLLPWTDGISRKNHAKAKGDFVCLRSDDNGVTWKGYDPQEIGVWAFSPYGKIIELSNGEVICAGWGYASDKGEIRSGIIRSQDQGETFGQYAKIGDVFSETDLTLLHDGRILALLRRGRGFEPETHYAHSSDGGYTWTTPQRINMFGENFNAWYTAKGTLVAACRGIDGSGVHNPGKYSPAELEKHLARRRTPQEGYGIHFFRAAKEDGSEWDYLFALPDPLGLEYRAHHEAGEPCFVNLPDGNLFVGYYSYDETIYDTLNPGMPHFTKSESTRIAHCFKRRPCACVVREV